MAQNQVTGNQLMAIHRSLTATVPSDLTHDEAAAFISTGGFFNAVETEWLKQRTVIGKTMYYRKYLRWASFPLHFIVTPLLNGLTLSILWQWFVVEVYGLAEIPVPVAIGIMLMAGLITRNIKRVEWKDASYGARFWRMVLLPFYQTAMFLGVGWFFHLFI